MDVASLPFRQDIYCCLIRILLLTSFISSSSRRFRTFADSKELVKCVTSFLTKLSVSSSFSESFSSLYMPPDYSKLDFLPSRLFTFALAEFSNIGKTKCLTIFAANSGVILSRLNSGVNYGTLVLFDPPILLPPILLATEAA